MKEFPDFCTANTNWRWRREIEWPPGSKMVPSKGEESKPQGGTCRGLGSACSSSPKKPSCAPKTPWSGPRTASFTPSAANFQHLDFWTPNLKWNSVALLAELFARCSWGVGRWTLHPSFLQRTLRSRSLQSRGGSYWLGMSEKREERMDRGEGGSGEGGRQQNRTKARGSGVRLGPGRCRKVLLCGYLALGCAMENLAFSPHKLSHLCT